MKDLFSKTKYINIEKAATTVDSQYTCPSCSRTYAKAVLGRNIYICPFCKTPARVSSETRLSMVADEGSFKEMFHNLKTVNPMNFDGYEDKIKSLNKRLNISEAVVTGTAEINGNKCCLAIMDSRFIMASMGSVVGERLTRLFEYATEQKLPVIVFCASGGARMHEGILSLMQMAKVSAAVGRHSKAGLLYIAVLTDPTTGGVTASFASLADITIAEPKATIGFAGRRVIEGTIKEKLDADFQTSEFLLKHGFVDFIAERRNLKQKLSQLLSLHSN